LIKYFGKDIKIEAAFCFKKNDNFVLLLGAISRFRLYLFLELPFALLLANPKKGYRLNRG
jgi:hypothetical protein